MDAERTDLAVLAAAIRGYLSGHPNAADTLEGVARWWLRGRSGNALLTDVERAMEQLVTTGDVLRHTLSDGTVIYERNKHVDPRRA